MFDNKIYTYKKIVKEHHTELIRYEKKRRISGGVNSQITEKTDNNLARAKRSINEILTLNLTPFSSMITLTYAKNMQDYDLSNIYFKKFIRKLGLSYLVVKELQKRGAIHYHLISFTEVTYNQIKEAWPHGYVYVEQIQDFNINALTNYFAKYVANRKKGQLIQKEKRLYSTSRDVKRYKREVLADNTEWLSADNYVEFYNNVYTKRLFNNTKQKD